MKKRSTAAFLFICSALLTAGFAIRLYYDYTLHYAYGLYAAERAFEFMLPAIGCLIAGAVMIKK